MKLIILITLILTLTTVFALVAFGQEDSTHSIIITENTITERSEYGVNVTAHVKKAIA